MARSARIVPHGRLSRGAELSRRKFHRFFPGGFKDENYLAWERDYKWTAHQQWDEMLNQITYRRLLRKGEFVEIATRAVKIESRTNLLFSFEKMALRDAVKTPVGASAFAKGLYEYLHGSRPLEQRFARWCEVVGSLPRVETRVLNWPIVTVFPFIALPDRHMFLKPSVTRNAARVYGFDFKYESRPQWPVYENLLEFADTVLGDVRDMRPRDMIDVQSFIWVQGSDEYNE